METYTLTDTSPAAAGTTVGAATYGLRLDRAYQIYVKLQGATGGTLDVYLQRKVGPNAWTDWCHFTQLAAGGAAVVYSLYAEMANATTITTVTGTDSTPNVSLGAGTFNGGHPGDAVRFVFVAGSGTSAGAVQTVQLIGVGGVK